MAWRRGNRLHLISESEASGRVAEIYDDLKAALGIGYVPFQIQAFAAYPEFLNLQWNIFRPVVATRECSELADRLQAEAYTHIHNYFKVPSFRGGLAVSQAAPIMEQFCSVEAAMLLLLSAQLQSFEAPTGKEGDAHPADRLASTPAPQFVDSESSSADIRRAMEEIRHALELPFSSDEQRALAHWPDLFFDFSRALKPSIQTMFHEQAVFRMRESGWNCAQEIPLIVEMDVARLMEGGVNDEDIAVVTRLTELLVRGSACSVLNASFAKIGLEGGNQERSAPLDEERVA